MPCVGRRGCAGRFRDRLDSHQLLAILVHHGSCGICHLDVTDNPRFRAPITANPPPPGSKRQIIPVPYCPACYEERWPTGAAGPFEQGQLQVYRPGVAG